MNILPTLATSEVFYTASAVTEHFTSTCILQLSGLMTVSSKRRASKLLPGRAFCPNLLRSKVYYAAEIKKNNLSLIFLYYAGGVQNSKIGKPFGNILTFHMRNETRTSCPKQGIQWWRISKIICQHVSLQLVYSQKLRHTLT